MRIITDNDKIGLGRALQTFMGYMNAQRTQLKTVLPQLERALEEGLTIDEIFNPANYARVEQIITKASLEDYIDSVIERRITVRGIKEDDGWEDSAAIEIIANFFHDYYVQILSTGGTYSTANAKINLLRAIKRNSLQALFSEKLIREVSEKSGQGDKLTCYQYICQILEKQEDYHIDESLTEAQEARRELEESTIYEPIDEGCNSPETQNNDSDTNNEEAFDINVETEGSPRENDQSIHGITDWPDISDQSFEPILTESVFIASTNPKLYKKGVLKDVIFGLTINEFIEMSKPAGLDLTIDEFITKLNNGDYRDAEETTSARNGHQFLNGELFPRFMECVQLQGLSIDELTASKMDLLNEDWDLRDEKTRKLQKLKELIFKENEGENDPDLLSVISDLEEYYNKEQ